MPSSRSASWWVLVAGAALSAVYALQLSPQVSAVASLTIGVGTFVVQVLAVRFNAPPRRGPWVLIAAAGLVFLIGLIIRPWAIRGQGLALVASDATTFSGYLLLAAGLVLMLPRNGLVRHAVTDGVIISIGVATLAITFLAVPAARIGDRPPLASAFAGLYPMWDVVILLLLLNLGFTASWTLASFRLLTLSVCSLLVGDLGYAWIGAYGQLTGPPLLDLPFMAAFTFLAAAVAHPSMCELGSSEARPVQAWSFGRLALIVPALAAPAVVLVVAAPAGVEVLVPAVASLALLAALLLRATSAVRSYAEVQEGLRRQATQDALTGLPNRVSLAEQLGELIGEEEARGSGTWVLFLDVDGFKLVNDHWGHEVGDVLLREMARRLSRLASGCMVARMSGDEFVVAGTGPIARATELADRIHAELSQPVVMPGIELIVTSSIGIAARTDQSSAEALLRDADLAMYRAKAEGPNRWRAFDAAMRQTVRDRVEIEMALRHALGRGQLWLAYQPIVECRTGRVTGAEALLRWSHPIRGPISPVDFIPVAEETGLIEDIGAFVLEAAFAQLAGWRDLGILADDFTLSVNVSGRQLRDDSLLTLIGDRLALHDLAGSRIALELTESIVMDDSPTMAVVLNGLRELGVGLAVDDFGTGYSSLSYLSRFPVTTVKIDRSFVRGLGVDAGDEAIARSVVAMASALELSVIAEGVESDAQRRTLADLDVVHAQGWLWGAAVPPEVFATQHLGRAAVGQAGVGNW